MVSIVTVAFWGGLIGGIATAYHASINNKSILWGGVVFVTGMVGIVFYAFSLASDASSSSTSTVPDTPQVCDECGASNRQSNDYCGDCGERLGTDNELQEGTSKVRVDGQIQCGLCGAVVDESANSCQKCGRTLTDEPTHDV